MSSTAKFNEVLGGKGPAWKAYFRTMYGPMPLGKAILMELAVLLFCNVPGALGYALRKVFYRPFFGACPGKLVIGRGVSFRYPGKIFFRGNAVLDDYCVVDATGESNHGITIGDGVYIGKRSNVYCKNGDLELGDRVSLSADCIVFSSNRLTMKPGSKVGSFSYLLSGGEYDYKSPVPFCEQDGTDSVGPLEIGENCWIGAHVTILDGASLGDKCVAAAGAVVTKPQPGYTVVAGVPARFVKSIAREA